MYQLETYIETNKRIILLCVENKKAKMNVKYNGNLILTQFCLIGIQ